MKAAHLFLAALCIGVGALVVYALPRSPPATETIRTTEGSATITTDSGRTTITARDSRAIVEALVRTYGYAVTWEDPTPEAEPGSESTIEIRPVVVSFSAMARAPEALAALISAQSVRPQLLKSGDVFHIVPPNSFLDARITIPEQSRGRNDTLQAVFDAIRETTGVRILFVGFMSEIMEDGQHLPQYTLSALDEPARDVFQRAVDMLVAFGPHGWTLRRNPGGESYALSILQIPDKFQPKPVIPRAYQCQPDRREDHRSARRRS
jgi:hypothetical protein